MAQHNDIGKWGEQLAVDLLITKGYAIVHRNWQLGNKEIDIVAMKDNFIVFVEVKTRTSDFVDPLMAVDRRRMMRMVSAANTYVQAYNIPHDVRFDIITIICNPAIKAEAMHSQNPSNVATPVKIEHIEDAFLPPLRTIR